MTANNLRLIEKVKQNIAVLAYSCLVIISLALRFTLNDPTSISGTSLRCSGELLITSVEVMAVRFDPYLLIYFFSVKTAET